MMINTSKHSIQRLQPKLGLLAYWHVISAPMFTSNNDRSEITHRVREGWDD
jgi:hypothetical protein